MNNVTQFPSTPYYPQLNVAMLRQAANSASSAGIEAQRLFVQTHYLPTLHSRVTRVDNAIRVAHFQLRDIVQSIDIKVAINTKTLRQYQAELKTAVASERQEILDDIAMQTSRIVALVGAEHNRLKTLYAPMNDAMDRSATHQYLEQLTADKERLPTDIQELNSRRDELEQKRKTLTEAMALIEAKGFAAVGKDTLLNAQEITKLGMAGPEVAVIEKAIELTQQLLEKLESLVNYFGLMDARNTVRKQIEDLLDKAGEHTAELRLVGMRGDLIAVSHDFDDHRQRYVSEFEKIIAAHHSFLSVYSSVNAEDPQAVTQFVVDALALASHLKVVA